MGGIRLPLLISAAIAFSGLTVAETARADGGGAQAAFERLKSLAGKWQGTSTEDPKSTIEVEYKVTAGGSAVVETEYAGLPHEMLTMYHLDGENLVMTHYCAAGNQPRLLFDPKRSSEKEIYFDFVSGSDMDPAKDVHIHSGKFRWNSENEFDSEWVAYKDGRPHETTKYSLKRKRD